MANELQSSVKTLVRMGMKKALVRNPMLRNLAFDASDQMANFEDTIRARAAGELSVGDVDLAAGLGAGTETDFKGYPVTLDQYKKIGFSFNAVEFSKDEKLGEAIQDQSEKLANGISTTVTLAALALVTAGNYDNATGGNAPITAAVGAGDRSTVIDAGVKLSTAEIEEEGRYLLANPSLYGEFAEDEVVARADTNGGVDTIQSGRVSRVHGFDIGEYSRMPATGNLRGIAAHRDAFIVASRLPRNVQELAEAPATARFVPISDPGSGLTVVWYEYYDADKMTVRRFVLVMFGVGVGRPEALVRIISA